MTFHGNNELVVEHITEAAMSEIRQQIFGIWKDGIESDEQRDSIWRVKFKNTPWNMSGPHKKRYLLLLEQLEWRTDFIQGLGHDCDSVPGVRNTGALFPSWPSMTSFFSQGYAFQTSINIGFQVCRQMCIIFDTNICLPAPTARFRGSRHGQNRSLLPCILYKRWTANQPDTSPVRRSRHHRTRTNGCIPRYDCL